MKLQFDELVQGVIQVAAKFKAANSDKVLTGEEIHGLLTLVTKALLETLGLWNQPVIDNRPKTDA